MITLVIAAEHHPDTLEPQQMRQALSALMHDLAERDGLIARQRKEALFKQALIDKLTHENAVLKRLKFGLKSEKMNAEQRSLLDETLDADLAAVSDEIAQAMPESPAAKDKQTPKRQALPAELPRQTFEHEPESTVCAAPGCGAQMKRIGQDVSEKLDYVPGVFSVHCQTQSRFDTTVERKRGVDLIHRYVG